MSELARGLPCGIVRVLSGPGAMQASVLTETEFQCTHELV